MKRRLLKLATVSAVLFCGFFLTRASWLKAASSTPSRAAQLDDGQDPYGTASAQRFRRCQESHWRSCVLQR
jgi:hypothetical protein